MPSFTAEEQHDMEKQGQRHALNWFEIPVRDMDRAQAFYETLLGTPMRREQMGPQTLAVFAYDEAGVGGCLLAGKHIPEPSLHGALVYLTARPSLDAVLARLEAAGGRLATPKLELPGDMGCFAHITDTEGNRVGLHSLT
jgi:predicted enzyme related to lactoylglutathione lyase